MRSLALYYISIPCFAFLRKYTLYPTCRLLLIDLPRTANYNYKGSISSSGPLPVQESWNHMQDLKHVFSYLKPYRRDLFLAVGLVFVECIFEMVIPMLMSDLVDQGVPSHDMQVIMLQGSKMIICAVLALITGLLYARFAAHGVLDEIKTVELRQKTSAFVRQFRTDPSGVMDEIQASGKLSPEQVQTILNAWNAFAGGDAHAIH